VEDPATWCNQPFREPVGAVEEMAQGCVEMGSVLRVEDLVLPVGVLVMRTHERSVGTRMA
ncbi:hypothetical protein, partial [Methanoregula sp.]|uniref:hypothetical protein n=1 Tax=Methanoregula sp. TaxID=2052170 RepID=UPI0025F3A0E6